MTDQSQTKPVRSLFFIATLASAFASVVLMWAGWFLTHMPGINAPAPVAAAIALALLFIAITASTRRAGPGVTWKLGLAAALSAGVVTLLLLGSMLTQTEATVPDASTALHPSIKPNAAILAAGFLFLCAITGIAAATLAKRLAPPDPLTTQGWLARFSWTAALATALLILLGGLVTSTESGLAVPDWPNTYGANMFLYPIALMSDHRIFLEHSHRLFGSMVGLTTLALTASVLVLDKRRAAKAIAVFLLALVIFQGVLGGLRVTEQSPWLAILHGVTAQLFLALLVAQSVWLSPPWITLPRLQTKGRRRLKALATGATHATILQLALGAMFRHLPKGTHALWAHVAFSLAVITLVILAAGAAMNIDNEQPPLTRRLHRLGRALIAVVCLQFALGLGAIIAIMTAGEHGLIPTAEKLASGQGINDVPIHEILLATAHQANGAILLALVTATMVWAKRAYKKPANP